MRGKQGQAVAGRRCQHTSQRGNTAIVCFVLSANQRGGNLALRYCLLKCKFSLMTSALPVKWSSRAGKSSTATWMSLCSANCGEEVRGQAGHQEVLEQKRGCTSLPSSFPVLHICSWVKVIYSNLLSNNKLVDNSHNNQLCSPSSHAQGKQPIFNSKFTYSFPFARWK